MRFEGTQINIPVKGIIRAGTDNVAADGAMNEIVGMEFKEGSWMPYKEHEESWEVWHERTVDDGNGGATTEHVTITDIADVYLHKLSDGTSRYIFMVRVVRRIMGGRKLYKNTLWYEVSKDETNKKMQVASVDSTVVDTGLVMNFADINNVKSVSFVGNMLCAATDAGIKYYLYSEEGVYKETSTDIVSAPEVEFRVAKGLSKENVTDPYVEGLMYTEYHGDMDYAVTSGQDSERTIYKMFASAMEAARGELRDRGGLTGYFLVCYAYRLNNGDLVMASAPKLMCRPMERVGNKIVNYDNSRESTVFRVRKQDSDPVQILDVNTKDDKSAVFLAPYISNKEPEFSYITKVTNSDFSYSRTKDVYGNENGHLVLCNKDTSYYEIDGGGRRVYKAIWNSGHPEYTPAPAMPPLSCSSYSRQSESGGPARLQVTAFALSNMLQIKITKHTFDNNEIQSLCIFMSPEIDPYYNIDTKDIEGCLAKNFAGNMTTGGVAVNAYGMMVSAKRKSMDKIIDEIKGVSSMYLVEEITKDKFAELYEENGDEWFSLELEGLLGDTLVTREQLPVTAFDRTTTYANYIDAYNYRIHQYDYMQKLFDGFIYEDFYYHKGLGQHNSGWLSSDLKWEIRVDLEENGYKRSVVCHDSTGGTGKPYYIAPFLCYPNPYAKSITIRCLVNNDYWQEKTFPMTEIKNLGISAYISPELKPIALNTFDVPASIPTSIPTFRAENNMQDYHNGLKVSDTAYPMYFPTRLTYRLGNESIIGIARLTIPVSQDQRGAGKLVVFCTDGIYTMDVDTSGGGAYSNQYFASPEVCLNRNSICEIGGAVLFAGDKGLMMFSGENSVEMFTPHLNGEPRFLPADTASKEAHGIYRKMIDSTAILSTNEDNFDDSVSREDFVNFIQDEGTRLIYISNKNKLLAYNASYDFSYFIDIPTRNTTKLAMSALGDDDNIIGRTIWEGGGETFKVHTFGYLSEEDDEIACLVQSRPVVVQQDDKCAFRLVLTGYFEGKEDNWAELLVLGSLDGDHWRTIGLKEKKLEGGFHNIGCLTERGTWKYLMFIFAGKLTNTSHIDSVDITTQGRYNNKKR